MQTDSVAPVPSREARGTPRRRPYPSGIVGRIVRTVLFVCVENSFRSVMAEALFNANTPPGWKATSAGVDAAGKQINPLAYTLMQDIGIRVSKKRPEQGTPGMGQKAWRVGTVGGLCRGSSGAAWKR